MVMAAATRLPAGGHLIAIGPEFQSWGPHFFSIDWSHGYPTDVRRVRQLFAECGFEVVEARIHVLGTSRPVVASLLDLLFRLIPVRALDAFFKAVVGRELATAFMVVAGWTQLLVIGRKRP